MKLCNSFLLFLFLLIGVSSANYTALSYVDRPCGSDLSNLWLDVVAVVDNSQKMTNDGLGVIAANIVSVFSVTRIGTNPNQPKTTRLGLVTYNYNATVQADLDKYQSIDDLYDGIFSALSEVSTSSESNLTAGLSTAGDVIKQGSQNSFRLNYKKVIIVYTSFYDPDSIHIAQQLKANGVTIITVGVQTESSVVLKALAQIASPQMNFSGDGSNTETQKRLLEVNCFCLPDWIQYHSSGPNQTTFGVCLQPVPLRSVWRAAQIACRNRHQNAYLVNEYTQAKDYFVFDLVKADGRFDQPYSYHIGLFVQNGVWVWDQPPGLPNPPLKNWANWDLGYPVSSSSMSAGLEQQKGSRTVWRNVGAMNTAAPYVCEVASCDTDNYCP